jgi:hypothetical protein
MWDGAHCSLRLIEAFRHLAQVPVNRGPHSNSGYWARAGRVAHGSGAVLAGALPAPATAGDACCAERRQVQSDRFRERQDCPQAAQVAAGASADQPRWARRDRCRAEA